MSGYIPIINAFIEDTCVLAVIAYLPARGRTLNLLFSERHDRARNLQLGALLGLVGLTEVIFPGARAPYVTHTLIAIFATLMGGLPVGIIAGTVVLIGVAVLQTSADVLETAICLLAAVFLADAVRRLFGTRKPLLRALVAGAAGQSAVFLAHRFLFAGIRDTDVLAYALAAIPANGFGALLLQLILNDARARADAERHRLEAERARLLVAEAQLTALRARIHPHFLFNALNSIAGLCGISPDKAESAVVSLARLMRRALDADPAAPLRLADEIEYVCGYLEIEQHRLGSRLAVQWSVDESCKDALIPPFALQTLVENAVTHGVASRMEPGTIRIMARRGRKLAVIAVADDGPGMTPLVRAFALRSGGEQEHGLLIQTQQLALLYGETARLRLFTRQGKGTFAAFAVPLPPAQSREEISADALRAHHR